MRYAQVEECGEREVKWLAYSRTHEDQQADDGTAPTGHLEKQELVFNDADVAEKRERERDVEEGSLTVRRPGWCSLLPS